jgi:uncharacterized membrane protein HdeD (DUF308 family)
MAVLFGHYYRSDSIDLAALRSKIEQNIRDHRGWFVFQGISFLIFGFLAAILPGVTAISAAILIGALLLVTGLFQLVASVRARMHWWSFLSALLSILVGGLMLWMPLAGALSLVMLAAIFFAVEGLFEILLALEFRPARNWGWMLASGIASVILFGLLWMGFPTLSVIYLGLLIAINFIFYGVSLLMLVGSMPKVKNIPIRFK